MTEIKKDKSFLKIIQIINSCKTTDQLKTSVKIIENWRELCKKKQNSKRFHLKEAFELVQYCDVLENILIDRSKYITGTSK
jgi:hypothetical protein